MRDESTPMRRRASPLVERPGNPPEEAIAGRLAAQRDSGARKVTTDKERSYESDAECTVGWKRQRINTRIRREGDRADVQAAGQIGVVDDIAELSTEGAPRVEHH